ncbi:hypothetical protein [Psychrobacillus sp. BM2]|uniref:hypothetical protein n=1 Tax=Psychrobacillus sp. BM2 TaxID=3400421 RepID=UPI003B011F42
MQVKNFENVLSANKNRGIGLHLNNNQFVDGILLDVKKDHVVLKVNQNVVYFAIHQIQALSKSAKYYHATIETSPYLNRSDLTDVLIALRYHWITVNDFGNHILSGVLNSIFEDHIILINNKELLYIPTLNITNISSDISKNDLTFLNKREQINIQNLYKTNISKGLMEVKKSYPINDQESTIPDISILVNNEFKESAIIEKVVESISISSEEEIVPKADNLVNDEFKESANIEKVVESISISIEEEVIPNTVRQMNDEFEEAIYIEKVKNISISIEEEVISNTVNLVDDGFKESAFIEKLEESITVSSEEEVTPNAENLVNDEFEVVAFIEEVEASISQSGEEEVIPNAENLVDAELEVPTDNEKSENNGTTIIEEQLDKVIKMGYVDPATEDLVELGLNQVGTQEFEENDEANTVKSNLKETYKRNSLIEDEPEIYSLKRSKQKSAPLTAWSAMNTDQSTIAIQKKTKSQSEVPVESITVKQNLDLNNSKHVVNHTNEKRKSEEEIVVLDEKPKPAEKKNQSTVVNAISEKERNKMLENQYYALMNYATKQITNSIKSEQEGGKSYFHPSYNLEFYNLDENRAGVKSFGTSETNSSSPREEKNALEKQFISLMRHATKMYRKLREY